MTHVFLMAGWEMGHRSSLQSTVSMVFAFTMVCHLLAVSNVLGDNKNSLADNTTSDATKSVNDQYRRDVLPILEKYCFGCHGYGASEGNLSFDELSSGSSVAMDVMSWWSVLKNVRSDVMPPDGEDQPSDSEKHVLSDWIINRVFSLDRDAADPGPGTLRRLNRQEYRNTIRDLMGIEFDTSVEFPPDDSGDGFDNNADALSISPLLAEKYIDAARDIVDRAVPKTSLEVPVQLVDAAAFTTDIDAPAQRLVFDEAAIAIATFEISDDAEYRILIPVEINGSFNFNPARSVVQVSLDGEVLHDHEYGWTNNFVETVSVERQLNQGSHLIQFTLNPVESNEAGTDDLANDGTSVRLKLPTVRIEGPLDRSYWKKPDGYDRFFHLDAPPSDDAERLQYATDVLRRFCRRAYRRPVEESHLHRLIDVAELDAPAKDAESSSSLSFEQRIGRAMTAVLASPRFLFRVEHARTYDAETYPEVDEFSLASRLSYFLWSTMPDDQLMQLAERGALRENLAHQVNRMLRDDRSERFIKNFVGQWLQTRDVESVPIDPLVALGVRAEYEQLRDYLESTASGRREPPEDASVGHRAAYRRYREIRELRDRLNGDVRRDMADETERHFSYVLRGNRSLVELIAADYAFLNERLAKHYGVPKIEGNQIRRVQLPPESPLGGVLTQGTFLVVTSNPTRTSPVKRGLFILDNILGTPAPPAPANVPELEESAGESELSNPTLRQLLEIHRSEALCRSCHARFDPLGLAFENFTAIGTWRDNENGESIQPAGRLISGESFENVTELKKVLAGPRRNDFYRCLAERTLSYAIGRSLDFGDEVALEEIILHLEEQEGNAQALIMGVVNSSAFQRIRRPVGNITRR
ncbi:DUF1592 domain-containing protein [Thalassoglobus sp. JC818]|uniref:DUF1592 domain-containing protein n=1 Tax=Thalassoglobus sp. JC818 TaxID=3232136 RepID=UPI003459E10C